MYDKRTDGHSKFDSIHNDDLRQIESKVFDIPVYNWSTTDTQARELVFMQQRIRENKGTGIPAEVLPGELICKDNIIRREIAAADRPITGIEEALTSTGATVRRITIKEAAALAKKGASIVWRPEGTVEGGHYALEVTS
jgi:hypothetical protein